MRGKTVQEIRREFGESDRKRDEGLCTPPDVMRCDNLSYGPFGEWNLLDIYYPKDTKEPRPTIVSVHGGAWVYGTKEVYQFYCMDLARRGFTVVNFNYRLAPENKYPAALEDINLVFCFLKERAYDYYVDMENLFVVGDSAGAQLASQYLTMYAAPAYASKMNFRIPDMKIKAAALNCGLYDAKRCAEFELDEPFLEYVRDLDSERLDELDIMHYMNGSFPPSFIMSSYYDFLLENAKPMYEKLRSLGVESELKIYGSKDQEEIAHVFHVNVRLPEADICNDDECRFFKKHIV